jgi:hypothetical protein
MLFRDEPVFFSALGAVEENPGHKVLGEIHEPMELASSGKQDVAALEDDFLLSAKKAAGTAYDDVNFVARMRLLWVRPMRRIEFDGEGAVTEQLDKTLAVGPGQASERIVYSKVTTHSATDRRREIRRLPSSLLVSTRRL